VRGGVGAVGVVSHRERNAADPAPNASAAMCKARILGWNVGRPSAGLGEGCFAPDTQFGQTRADIDRLLSVIHCRAQRACRRVCYVEQAIRSECRGNDIGGRYLPLGVTAPWQSKRAAAGRVGPDRRQTRRGTTRMTTHSNAALRQHCATAQGRPSVLRSRRLASLPRQGRA
jgi:hypothetical protein